MEFADKVKYVRKQLNLSQEKLASLLGVSFATVNKCLGRKHNNGCTKSMVRKEILEDFVVSNIVKLLSEKEVKDKMISSLMRMQEESITDNADLQRLTKERKTTETQITNIMMAIENGGTSATAMKRLRELETIERTRTESRRTRKSHSHTKSPNGIQVYRRRNASVLRAGAKTRAADADKHSCKANNAV